MIIAPQLDEAAEDDHRIDNKCQCGPRQCDCVAHCFERWIQARILTAVGLARDRRIRLFAQPHALQEECGQGQRQQGDGENGGLCGISHSTDDRKEDLCREDRIPASED